LGDLKKMRPNHLVDIFQKKMRPTPKILPKWRNFAQSGHTVATAHSFSFISSKLG
jgi:hypothetical protein